MLKLLQPLKNIMGFMHIVVTSVLVLVVLHRCASSLQSQNCKHEVNRQLVKYVTTGDGGGGVRGKRLVSSDMRIRYYYDTSVDDKLSQQQIMRLKYTIVPTLIEYFEDVLKPIIPVTSTLHLRRFCRDARINEDMYCEYECVETRCGLMIVPEEHLQACTQCNGIIPGGCQVVPETNGTGVADADYLLYISAYDTEDCYAADAFGGVCQLEYNLDRPFAGFINFCPRSFTVKSDSENLDIAKHQLFHALGFSSTVFAFYRDEQGKPRTPRDINGNPPFNGEYYVPSDSTILEVNYPDWSTRNGEINHTVTLFVTPTVLEEAKYHFNCSNLLGVELESQGYIHGISNHWEKRILGNEGMTATTTDSAVFSRMTLAVMEDSGWYYVDYKRAEFLAWGRNLGCRFAHGSCGEWIHTRSEPIAPFCDRFDDRITKCTAGLYGRSQCQIKVWLNYLRLPLEYQYFNSNSDVLSRTIGGKILVKDFCPFEGEYEAGFCEIAGNQPSLNIAGEFYGLGSRCIVHGSRDWSITKGNVTNTAHYTGSGCYEFECIPGKIIVKILGYQFLCSCEGEEIFVNTTVDNATLLGSFICPPYEEACHRNGPCCTIQGNYNKCYGTQTDNDGPVEIVRNFTCYQDFDNEGMCIGEIGPAPNASQCCDNGANAYKIILNIDNTQTCAQCPNSLTVGFEETSISVSEEEKAANVCVVVHSAGNCAVSRSTDVWVSTINGTAREYFDFVPVTENVTLEVLRDPWHCRNELPMYCIWIPLKQDKISESNKTFTVIIQSSDPGVTISPDMATVTIIDDDDTQPLSLINNSPRVNGNMIVAEFTTGDTVINITCHVAGAPDPTPQDCSSGSFNISLPARLKRRYILIIRATLEGGGIKTISRRLYTEPNTTRKLCSEHLINSGISVTGNLAIIDWQGTGPIPGNRVKTFFCKYHYLTNFIEERCTPPLILAALPVGTHRIVIRPESPINPPSCTNRRCLSIRFRVNRPLPHAKQVFPFGVAVQGGPLS